MMTNLDSKGYHPLVASFVCSTSKIINNNSGLDSAWSIWAIRAGLELAEEATKNWPSDQLRTWGKWKIVESDCGTNAASWAKWSVLQSRGFYSYLCTVSDFCTWLSSRMFVQNGSSMLPLGVVLCWWMKKGSKEPSALFSSTPISRPERFFFLLQTGLRNCCFIALIILSCYCSDCYFHYNYVGSQNPYRCHKVR